MESQLWWARILQTWATKAVYSTSRGGPAAEDSSPEAVPGVGNFGRTPMFFRIKDNLLPSWEACALLCPGAPNGRVAVVS